MRIAIIIIQDFLKYIILCYRYLYYTVVLTYIFLKFLCVEIYLNIDVTQPWRRKGGLREEY